MTGATSGAFSLETTTRNLLMRAIRISGRRAIISFTAVLETRMAPRHGIQNYLFNLA